MYVLGAPRRCHALLTKTVLCSLLYSSAGTLYGGSQAVLFLWPSCLFLGSCTFWQSVSIVFEQLCDLTRRHVLLCRLKKLPGSYEETRKDTEGYCSLLRLTARFEKFHRKLWALYTLSYRISLRGGLLGFLWLFLSARMFELYFLAQVNSYIDYISIVAYITEFLIPALRFRGSHVSIINAHTFICSTSEGSSYFHHRSCAGVTQHQNNMFPSLLTPNVT